MKLDHEILINQFGQGVATIDQILLEFGNFDSIQKKEYLNGIVNLIMQSKPKDEDVELAIKESGLKPTFTPCVLLRKGVANHNLRKLVELRDNEVDKAFVLLLSLFKIAYYRRYENERNNPDKWWYWDLSDKQKVEVIKASTPR